MQLTPEQLEALGLLADKAESLFAASKLPASDAIHAQCLRSGLEEIGQSLKQLFAQISGDNPWCE